MDLCFTHDEVIQTNCVVIEMSETVNDICLILSIFSLTQVAFGDVGRTAGLPGWEIDSCSTHFELPFWKV